MINRTLAPPVIMPHHLDLVNAKHFELDNGLLVYYYTGCSEPVMHLSIIQEAGKYFQEKNFEAFLTAKMLKKGTDTKSALEIQETLDFYGSSLSFSTNLYTSRVSLSCLTEKLQNVLPILKDIILHASFPEEELKIQKQTITKIKNKPRKKRVYLFSKI